MKTIAVEEADSTVDIEGVEEPPNRKLETSTPPKLKPSETMSKTARENVITKNFFFLPISLPPQQK
jgi:hypothetical protein